ncbi:hypothetical protein [Arenicella xantha]|uniref:Uncharacterized protein n=1 Tax=Arenicella xantha TaxID=644221 RepID=A0A395JNK5_9GAMM|nr:hypothetical protein [Arenicella xantha]RBP53240.1 hypothetical protein DFR28_101626 [Arenicella xantha]
MIRKIENADLLLCRLAVSRATRRLCFGVLLISIASVIRPVFAQQVQGAWTIDASESQTNAVDGEIERPEPEPETEPPLASQLGVDSTVDGDKDNSPSVDLPTREKNVPSKPIVDLTPEVSLNLEILFKRILELQDSEDAFSANLGEAYLSYGQALMSAGRLDEARKMFANALHLSKINHGVNSLEQRPILGAMFELASAKGNLEAAQDSINRIIWLEGQSEQERDALAFDMVVRLGNEFINRFEYRPNAGEAGLMYLEQAEKYLKYAIKKYEKEPLNRYVMPYGELALVYFLRSTIKVDTATERYRLPAEWQERKLDFPQKKIISVPNGFANAERYLLRYLEKANAEGATEHAVKALINLGDLSLLYSHRDSAALYYQSAWESAQELPVSHQLFASFQNPILLPDFYYSRTRPPVEDRFPTVLVPLKFKLGKFGRVRSFGEIEEAHPYPDLIKRAKRAVKRLRYRPLIDRGHMIASDELSRNIKVRAPRSKSEKG